MAIVLGVDPGLASFGWAQVDVLRDGRLVALAAGVVRTAKSARKANVLASADSLRRARDMYQALCALPRPQAIAAESMSWPRNAGAATKVALSWGVLAAYAQHRGIPILQASPQVVKKTLCGFANASKEDVEVAVRGRVGCAWDTVRESGLARGLHEHMFDAMAVVVACADADVVRLLNAALTNSSETRPIGPSQEDHHG